MYLDKHVTVKKIQKQFHFADGHVSKFAKQLNLPNKRTSGRRISKLIEDEEKFKNLWETGVTLKKMSEELGVTTLTLDSWRRNLN